MLAIPVIIFRLLAYAIVPILIFTTVFLETQWPLLPAVASTIAVSNVAACISINDSNIIIFQFIYWIMCWTFLLGSYGIAFLSLLFNFGEYTIVPFVFVAVTVSFFLEVLFYCLIVTVRDGVDLGKFGVLHERIWVWVWKVWGWVSTKWEAICIAWGAVIWALGGRPYNQVIVTEAPNREDDVSPLNPASPSPPPYNPHDIDSHFLSSKINKHNPEVPV